MPRLKKISPAEALQTINQGQRLFRVNITGSLVIPLSAPFTNLAIVESVIQGDLNVWETWIEKNWDMTGTHIAGNLETSEVKLMGNADWMRLIVKGDLNLTDIEIGGTLSLDGATIVGDLLLEKANLKGYIYFSFAQPPVLIHAGTEERAKVFHLLAPSVPLAFESRGLIIE